jgi:hypothetical protein
MDNYLVIQFLTPNNKRCGKFVALFPLSDDNFRNCKIKRMLRRLCFNGPYHLIDEIGRDHFHVARWNENFLRLHTETVNEIGKTMDVIFTVHPNYCQRLESVEKKFFFKLYETDDIFNLNDKSYCWRYVLYGDDNCKI